MLHKERYAPARQLAGWQLRAVQFPRASGDGPGSTPAAQAWLGFTPSPQAGP